MLAMEVKLMRFVRRPALSLATIASRLAPAREPACNGVISGAEHFKG